MHGTTNIKNYLHSLRADQEGVRIFAVLSRETHIFREAPRVCMSVYLAVRHDDTQFFACGAAKNVRKAGPLNTLFYTAYLNRKRDMR